MLSILSSTIGLPPLPVAPLLECQHVTEPHPPMRADLDERYGAILDQPDKVLAGYAKYVCGLLRGQFLFVHDDLYPVSMLEVIEHVLEQREGLECQGNLATVRRHQSGGSGQLTRVVFIAGVEIDMRQVRDRHAEDGLHPRVPRKRYKRNRVQAARSREAPLTSPLNRLPPLS